MEESLVEFKSHAWLQLCGWCHTASNITPFEWSGQDQALTCDVIQVMEVTHVTWIWPGFLSCLSLFFRTQEREAWGRGYMAIHTVTLKFVCLCVYVRAIIHVVTRPPWIRCTYSYSKTWKNCSDCISVCKHVANLGLPQAPPRRIHPRVNRYYSTSRYYMHTQPWRLRIKLEQIASVKSDWSAKTQSSAWFARPSLQVYVCTRGWRL